MMIKERHFTLTGPTGFLLIACWIMAIGVIRSTDASPVLSSAESETLDRQDEANRVDDEFLNAVEDLVVGRLNVDDTLATGRHEQPDTWAVVAKRAEDLPVSSGGVNRAAHATGLHQRSSALNKNFIRFGRSGGHQHPRRALAIEKLRRAILDQSDVDNEDSLANYSHFPRSSRGLQSNFIRFGRSIPTASDNPNAQ